VVLTTEIKMLLNFSLIILVLTITIFRNVKTVIMLMLFLKQARGQQRSQPGFFYGTKYFDFKRATVFC